MSNTATLPITASERKLPKIDVRTVIIVAILSFGAGAYGATERPANAGAPAPQTAVATVPAGSGK